MGGCDRRMLCERCRGMRCPFCGRGDRPRPDQEEDCHPERRSGVPTGAAVDLRPAGGRRADQAAGTYRRPLLAHDSAILAPMAKPKTVYTCESCGGQQPKWQGQCPACGEWNALEAAAAPAHPPAPARARSADRCRRARERGSSPSRRGRSFARVPRRKTRRGLQGDALSYPLS